MMDHTPNGYDLSMGGAWLHLSPTASACWTTRCCSRWRRPAPQKGRYEFMLTINPLRVVGGTGSPVNPVAIM